MDTVRSTDKCSRSIVTCKWIVPSKIASNSSMWHIWSWRMEEASDAGKWQSPKWKYVNYIGVTWCNTHTHTLIAKHWQILSWNLEVCKMKAWNRTSRRWMQGGVAPLDTWLMAKGGARAASWLGLDFMGVFWMSDPFQKWLCKVGKHIQRRDLVNLFTSTACTLLALEACQQIILFVL